MSRASLKLATDDVAAFLNASAPDLESQEATTLFSKALEALKFANAAGGVPDMREYENASKLLVKGGKEYSNEELLAAHRHGLLAKADRSDKGINVMTPDVDHVAAKHICTAEPSQLEPIFLRQLQKRTINHGKILWVTITMPCFRVSGVQALVKDGEGRLAALDLYNFIPSSGTTADSQSLFPLDTRLGIKEPYYKLLNSGYFGLRIDNPCNLIIEPPKIVDMSNTPDKLKEEGNKMFAAKKFEQADTLYTHALERATDTALQLVLYLNRAAARLGQRQYDDALSDCDHALSIDVASVKGRYRRGQALFGMRRYDEAQAVYAAMIKEAQEAGQAVDKQWEEQHANAVAAIAQSTTGMYDLMTFPFGPDKQLETDVAEYFGPIAVGMCKDKKKGRGLFLTKNVKAGDVLLVERALAFALDDPNTLVMAISHEDGTFNKGSLHSLIQDLVVLANKNARANSVMSYLSTGQEENPGSLPVLDLDMLRPAGPEPSPAQQLSAYAVKGIVKINAFGFKACREPSDQVRRAISDVMRHPIPADASKKPRHISPKPVTQLMHAIMYGITSHALSSLLSKTSKADLNKADSGGYTALHLSVLQRNEYVCKALLKVGAKPSVKDELGMTPLHYAVGEYYNIDIAKALVEHGAPVDEPSVRGFTPLYGAVMKGRAEAVKWLLQNGANPYCENYLDGSAPADFAEQTGDVVMEQAFSRGGHDLGASAPRQGSGVWAVASFMNHSQEQNTRRRFIGRMMFVMAGVDMKAGKELTTSYGHDDRLKHWNIE
jgi:tetratricopeptide (TPR) repeat protein